MQILPLISARAQAANSSVVQSAQLSQRQSELFSSLLDNAQASTTSTAASSSSSSASSVNPVEAAAAPSEQDLMKLPMTKEDLAALRGDLKDQGFSDAELSDMDAKVSSDAGMTWGEMMDAVKKKVGSSEKSEKKEITNDDKVQLLGLFGKLGFTPTESQNLVDALAKGETKSVWAAVNSKVSGLSADSSVSLGSSEMTALGRAMNLSDAAQQRLAALFNQSNAEQGLSGQGVGTAMTLVKNELIAQLSKEAQALADFRQQASSVLSQAWERESGKKNASLHQDDVARKAAQVVAMSSATGGSGHGTGLNALADVPASGTGVSQQPAKADTAQSSPSSSSQTSDSSAAAAELNSKAGVVAAEQAAVSGQSGEHAAGASQAATGSGQKTSQVTSQPLADKSAANAATLASREASAFAGGQQQGGNAGGSFEQSGQESGWGEFWSKIRTEKTSGTTATTATAGQNATVQTLASMDAVSTSTLGQSAKNLSPAVVAKAAQQIETGILRNVGDAKQLTFTLSPDELGTVSVTLTVKDKEVRATISTDNADSAALLQEQLAKIKQSLEDQGLKVTKLDVQTGLPQDNPNAWQSPEQHNQAREQREALERLRTSVRLSRQTESMEADGVGAIPGTMTAQAAGVDLFA